MSLFKSQTRLAMAYTNEVGDKIYPVIVDIKKGIKSTEEIQFMSSDINTGVLSVAFIQGNDNYNVSGAEVICSVMRPDASTLELPCDIVRDNVVEVPLGINGTSQDGVYSFDFKVFKGGNKVVGTPIMNYSVSLSIGNDAVVEEDDRLPVLTMLMTQLTEIKDEAREAINQANVATTATREATENAIEATNKANETVNKVTQDTASAIAEVNATSDTMVETVNNAISSMDTTVNDKISEMTDAVNNKISEVDTAKTDMINDVSSTKTNMVTEVTNAKNEMTATVTNKVNEVEGRFNALTASQQQSSEVIDARDGETSLKARLDRDIEKANKELDKIKKLEESTVSTVETESDFTTVEATSGGYFEDVKLEGKTLVNLSDINAFSISGAGTSIHTNIDKIKPNTTYTRIVYITKNTLVGVNERGNVGQLNDSDRVILSKDIQIAQNFIGLLDCSKYTISDITKEKLSSVRIFSVNTGGVLEGYEIILEGDHTQNPPSYFEGLKSVGQSASEDGTDEIVVSSVNGDGNLFEILEDIQSNSKGLDIKFDKAKQEIKVNGTCTDDIYFYAKSPNIDRFDIKAKNSVCSLSIDICEGTATIGDSNEIMHISIPNNLTGKAINLRVSDKFAKIENVSLGSDFTKSWIRFKKNARFNNCTIRIMLNKGDTSKPYTPHISDKKRLLYYNNETQTWEKPILREWDSIKKHSDGKYYYHQRSGEVVLNGSENEEWAKNGVLSTDLYSFMHLQNQQIKPTNSMEDFICDKLIPANYNNASSECISKYADGTQIVIKITTSKLSTQDEAGFKQWLQANNVTVVYQLAQEKVYECTNIDLITYANETNYIVESGAISPKTTLKVHNNISNVVKILQEKVSLLENKFIEGLKQVLAGDMYSLAELLYPEDFEEVETENSIMLLPLE